MVSGLNGCFYTLRIPFWGVLLLGTMLFGVCIGAPDFGAGGFSNDLISLMGLLMACCLGLTWDTSWTY